MPRRLTVRLLILWSLLSPSGLAWGAAARGAALQEGGHNIVCQKQAGQGSYAEKLALVNIQAGGEVALGSEYKALVPELNSDNEVQEFGKILSVMGSLGTAAVTRLAGNHAKIGKGVSGGGSGVSTNTRTTVVGTDATKEGGQTFERAISNAEFKSNTETGLLRGGREGVNFFTNKASPDAKRAQQRLGLDGPLRDSRIQFRIKNNVEVTGPRRAAPGQTGTAGGGREFSTNGRREIEILRVVPLRK